MIIISQNSIKFIDFFSKWPKEKHYNFREQRTALMLSVSGNHLECVQTLLKYGADPNIVDTEQHSCLFRAVSFVVWLF